MGDQQADPHKWLEEVLGEKPLAWVKERNIECIAAVGEPKDTDTYKRILTILDSKDKIPNLYRIGGPEGMYYNFWQDDVHVQGIWRKTSMESYKSGKPEWKTVIDVDALPPPAVDTAETWVWHGSTLLDEGPDGVWDRAIIALSPGGSDADTRREFDLKTEKWVEASEGGFAMPKAAKTQIQYRSRNEVLVGTDFGGDGKTLTDSGYPRVVKSWKRGTPIESATVVFEGEQTDVAASQYAYHDRGFVHEFQLRSITFWTSKYWYRVLSRDSIKSLTADADPTPFAEVKIPEDAEMGTFANVALITLRSDWSPPGCSQAFKAGSLLSLPMEEVMKEMWGNIFVLFEPTPSKSLQEKTETKSYVILKTLQDVRTVLEFWRFEDGKWIPQTTGAGEAVAVGEDVTVECMCRDHAESNDVWVTREGFLVPDSQEVSSAENGCTVTTKLRSKPAMFKADGLVCEQHFATSKDGTKVPYFTMRRKDIAMDGSNPTLLDAYGGFEISMLPYYSGGVGAGWLEKGGIKVIANIRGGGEYGPTWHQAALKELRHKAYEDVEAVGQDLVARGITSPPKLAVIGGSNGGLLVGNMLTRPVASKLFGAAVCQVPLLDMKVFSKLLAGASWMGEYGDPETDDWKFIRKHSPYHRLRHDCLLLPEPDAPGEQAKLEGWVCPKVLFTTSTRDDRVHPGHARKMVRALKEEAVPEQAPTVLYWENTEGGHGGAADNKQRAHMWALTYLFLGQQLGLKM